MSILSLLDIAKSGITAQRLALEVTSENITNVNTPGYSKQTTVFTTATYAVFMYSRAMFSRSNTCP